MCTYCDLLVYLVRLTCVLVTYLCTQCALPVYLVRLTCTHTTHVRTHVRHIEVLDAVAGRDVPPAVEGVLAGAVH